MAWRWRNDLGAALVIILGAFACRALVLWAAESSAAVRTLPDCSCVRYYPEDGPDYVIDVM